MEQNGQKGYYVFNGHGDVVQMRSASGEQVYRKQYDAFGLEMTNYNETNQFVNPFGYAGEYTDVESGNIYLRARYYNPNTGRFMSEDPAKDGTNWYAYAGNNPVLYVDPTGLKPGDSFKTLDEAAIDAGNYYLEKTYQNDEEMCGLFYQKADGTYTYQDAKNTSPNKKDAFYISWTKAPLAVIHTHVYRDVDDPNNQFSYPGWTSGDNGNSDTNLWIAIIYHYIWLHLLVN